MLAKNKYQRRVVAVDRKIKPIGKRIENWFQEHVFDVPGVRNKYGWLICMKCNHKWKSGLKLAWQDQIAETKCPNCKRELKVRLTEERTEVDQRFFTVIDKIEEFQVIRTFCVDVKYWTNKPPKYWDYECYRIYLDKEGRSNVVGKLRQGGYYYWSNFSGYMELRQPDTINSKYNEEGVLYPNWKLQDYTIKAGFNAYEYQERKYIAQRLMKIMLTIPNLETIEKTGDEDLIHYAFQEPDDIKKYWSTLRICWRNNYKVKSWRSYFDMIKAMQKFGKDLRNKHYVCPGNFSIAHNYWTDRLYQRYKRMNDIRRLKAEERQKLADWEYQQKLLKKKDEYNMRMLKFKDLILEFGKIRIVPLMTVDIVEEAGELMHHCIYKTDDYWTNKDNLLFGAYVEDKLIETTQYRLSSKEILHSYGKYNKESKHHKQIKNLIKNSENRILDCMVSKVKRKTKEIKQSA